MSTPSSVPPVLVEPVPTDLSVLSVVAVFLLCEPLFASVPKNLVCGVKRRRSFRQAIFKTLISVLHVRKEQLLLETRYRTWAKTRCRCNFGRDGEFVELLGKSNVHAATHGTAPTKLVEIDSNEAGRMMT